jgi:hypothetical protein
MRQNLCATNSSHPNTGFEIFVPGLGLLLEQYPLADRPISLSARRALFFPSDVEIDSQKLLYDFSNPEAGSIIPSFPIDSLGQPDLASSASTLSSGMDG